MEHTAPPRQAAFFDRDGTIIADYPDAQWAFAETPELLPGAVDALRTARQAGYAIIFITNQYIIGEGIITAAQYARFSARLLRLLEAQDIPVLDVFHCPHARSAGCACCKPEPGLIAQALARYPSLRLQESFFVGDSPCDQILARRLGLRFYGVGLPAAPDCIHLDSIAELAGFLGRP